MTMPPRQEVQADLRRRYIQTFGALPGSTPPSTFVPSAANHPQAAVRASYDPWSFLSGHRPPSVPSGRNVVQRNTVPQTRVITSPGDNFADGTQIARMQAATPLHGNDTLASVANSEGMLNYREDMDRLEEIAEPADQDELAEMSGLMYRTDSVPFGEPPSGLAGAFVNALGMTTDDDQWQPWMDTFIDRETGEHTGETMELGSGDNMSAAQRVEQLGADASMAVNHGLYKSANSRRDLLDVEQNPFVTRTFENGIVMRTRINGADAEVTLPDGRIMLLDDLMDMFEEHEVEVDFRVATEDDDPSRLLPLPGYNELFTYDNYIFPDGTVIPAEFHQQLQETRDIGFTDSHQEDRGFLGLQTANPRAPWQNAQGHHPFNREFWNDPTSIGGLSEAAPWLWDRAGEIAPWMIAGTNPLAIGAMSAARVLPAAYGLNPNTYRPAADGSIGGFSPEEITRTQQVAHLASPFIFAGARGAAGRLTQRYAPSTGAMSTVAPTAISTGTMAPTLAATGGIGNQGEDWGLDQELDEDGILRNVETGLPRRVANIAGEIGETAVPVAGIGAGMRGVASGRRAISQYRPQVARTEPTPEHPSGQRVRQPSPHADNRLLNEYRRLADRPTSDRLMQRNYSNDELARIASAAQRNNALGRDGSTPTPSLVNSNFVGPMAPRSSNTLLQPDQLRRMSPADRDAYSAREMQNFFDRHYGVNPRSQNLSRLTRENWESQRDVPRTPLGLTSSTARTDSSQSSYNRREMLGQLIESPRQPPRPLWRQSDELPNISSPREPQARYQSRGALPAPGPERNVSSAGQMGSQDQPMRFGGTTRPPSAPRREPVARDFLNPTVPAVERGHTGRFGRRLPDRPVRRRLSDQEVARREAAERLVREQRQGERTSVSRTAANEDDFLVLGIRPGVSRAEAKKAFNALSRKYHPDVFEAPHADYPRLQRATMPESIRRGPSLDRMLWERKNPHPQGPNRQLSPRQKRENQAAKDRQEEKFKVINNAWERIERTFK